MLMTLPENFFYIPGFGNRYAVKATETYSGVHNDIYSLVYPGATEPVVLPTKSHSKFGEIVRIAKYAGTDKQSFIVDSLVGLVLDSHGFKATQREYQGQTAAKQEPSAEKRWFIISRDEGEFGLIDLYNDRPEYETEERANDDAKDLAEESPGKEFYVVTTIRKFVLQSMTVTEL